MISPYISVIVPVYNAESTLESCIDSVLAQSFDDFELIAVNDGSTDSSAAIIDRYASSDSRVRHISKANGGVSSARNAGLDAASGKYVCFVDSDDFLPAGALDLLVSAVKSSRGAHFSSEDTPAEDRSAVADLSENRSVAADTSDVSLVLGGYVSLGSGAVIVPPYAGTYSRDLSRCIDDNYRFNSSLFRAVWGKLFLREAIGSLRFDESFSYGEDVVFVWSFLIGCSGASSVVRSSVVPFYSGDSCGSIVSLKTPVYVYSDTPDGLGSGLGTDRHIAQLLRFIPAYRDCLSGLSAAFPSSRAVSSLYHQDLVGRLVCRALTVFATRPSEFMNRENLKLLYSVMDSDDRLSISSLRRGQMLNLLLYRIHSVGFSHFFYTLSSRFCAAFHIHPKRY